MGLGKIVAFCVAVLVVKACLWRGKDIYYQYTVASPKFSALFVFGDSLADCGNNNYINTDVRTIFDFLASRMSVPFPAPWFQSPVELDITKGANFASGGSGLLDSTFQSLNVVSFGRQVKEFLNIVSMLEAGSEPGYYNTQQFLWDSIIAVNVGANDIAGNYMANASLSNTVGPEAFIESLLKVYENYLLRLQKMGGRKFVVFGIGSRGMRYSGLCYETANELFRLFNCGLQKLVEYLNTNLNESTLIYVKIHRNLYFGMHFIPPKELRE